MTVIDRAQDLVEAARAIIEADAEIQTLAGRQTNIVVTWNALRVDGAVPVIAYTPTGGGLATSGAPIKTERYDLTYACFATTKRDANRLAARITQILTWAAFNARGFDACQDPERSYRRFWPPHDPVPDSPAKARADVTVTLLVTT